MPTRACGVKLKEELRWKLAPLKHHIQTEDDLSKLLRCEARLDALPQSIDLSRILAAVSRRDGANRIAELRIGHRTLHPVDDRRTHDVGRVVSGRDVLSFEIARVRPVLLPDHKLDAGDLTSKAVGVGIPSLS